jgi:hypothetical protein
MSHMKKASMKPVAKAAGPTKTTPARGAKPSHDEEDKKWRTRNAMETLMRAEELKKDKALMKDVACLAKEQAAKLSGLAGKGK